jgi:hypothetical protein
MKRILLLGLLVACGFLTAGTLQTNVNFAESVPTTAALTGQEDASQILSHAQSFIARAKSSSYQGDFIIQAQQKGVTVPLFPAEFRMSYSQSLDKYLYEVTAPSVAVGSAILIHERPTLTAKVAPVDVADGCSGAVCSVDGQCGDCSGTIQTAESLGTFQKLISTGAFDLPYITKFTSLRAEKVDVVKLDGEDSTVVRFDRTLVEPFGLSDLLVTVRHRDGAPVAFDFVNTAGQKIKRIVASYVGSELTALNAVNFEQQLEVSIVLKSVESIKRNVSFNDSMFTREHLHHIVSTRPTEVE